jgi:excisionase family DNA binding protein
MNMSTEIEAKTEVAEVAGPEGYITKKELARRLKKTVRTVEHWQRKGALPYVKVGQSVLFNWDDVQAHLQSNFRVCRPRLEKQPVKV